MTGADRQRIALSWSGGKDSALALDVLRRDRRYDVRALLTTVSDPFRRISHHGVREELLDRQAEAIGMPVAKVRLAASAAGTCPNTEYEAEVGAVLEGLKRQGVTAIAHGDLFLADLRAYREKNLERAELQALFPLWGRDTRGLVLDFVRHRFRAKLCCVNAKLGRSFAGRELDEELLDDLPEGVDPAGENGEYHSFVYDGPIFRSPLDVRVTEVVEREGRFFAELVAGADPSAKVR